MKLLYLTTCRRYGPRLREVNNAYRAAIAGTCPGVVLGGPGWNGVGVDEVLSIAEHLRRAGGADVVFVSDPWHNFWDPCETYPDCPPLVVGIDEAPVPVVIESGDSQFYYRETVGHLQGGDWEPRQDRGVCIRAEGHRWRFDGGMERHPAAPAEEPGPPEKFRASGIFYLPHGTYPEMTSCAVGVRKEWDVVFSGSDYAGAYPARAEVAKALRASPDIRTFWLPHPSEGGAVVGPAFWRLLASARLAVAGTNCYRNLTMRYLEIPACGALAVGDVPDPEGELDGWGMHQLDVGGMEWGEIGGVIRVALEDAERLEERVRAAREFVIGRHSFRGEWLRVMGEIKRWLSGMGKS